MDVVSACPLRVASVLWQHRPGVFVFTVVCKATYTLRPVESPLAADQDPPNETDDHWNDDERRSLHNASDLAPFKQRADVFLVGHAYAPRGTPVSSLIARLIVGDVDKSIEAHADRVWTQDQKLREGPPFTKMPLRYERAGGGPSTSNPVGMPPDARPDRYGQVPIPNLQPPGYPLTGPDDAIPPIGLGPIAPGWPGRAAKLYGHAAGWDHRLGLRQPLPQDIDPGFFNAAPPDQQTDELRGDERIVLEHLHPEHQRLLTNLSGPTPKAVVKRPGARSQALALRCDTLAIDTDRGVCSLVWRGQVVLASADEAGRVVIAAAGEGADAREGGTRSPSAAPPPAAAFNKDVLKTMPGLPAKALKPALPFREVGPPGATPTAAARLSDDDATNPMLVLPEASGDALPFAPAVPTEDEPAQTLQPAAILFGASPTPWAPLLARDDAPAQVAAPPPPAPAPSAELPAPPPMIGPLATLGMATATGAPPPEPEAPAPPTVARAPAASIAEDTGLPLERYPLERCAAIAASIARTKPDKQRILEEHELAPETWEALDKHWREAVRAQVGRGRTAPLKAYDAAYVAQLEKERGPIRIEEYARIVVAQERGGADPTLAAMTLPRGALLRIQRVWLARLATDAELGKSLRAAVDDVRAQ